MRTERASRPRIRDEAGPTATRPGSELRTLPASTFRMAQRERRPSRRHRAGTGSERDRPGPGRPRAFPVDVEERGDEFRVSAELPGLRTQDIDVRVRKNRLQIDANYGEADEDGGGTYLRRERGREGGLRRRTITFPAPIDESAVSASYVGGVLRVHLAKRRTGRRVPVE